MTKVSANKTSETAAAKSNTSFFHKGGSSALSLAENGSSFFTKQNETAAIQTKLTIGQPNDKYEQEADATADKVVQQMAMPEIASKKEPSVQTKSLPPAITPFVQTKCESCEKEEKLQKKDEELVQESRLQRKPIFESNAEPPPDDEKNIQRKCAACEHEEKLQKKSDSTDSSSSSSTVESNLTASKGSGSPIPSGTRERMENSFGADFSGVRIHNDSSAVQMSKQLNAQAFTHGSDIYFNSGKYDVNSKGGQHLLAHELTHTLQQGAAIQTKKNTGSIYGVQSGVPTIQTAWYNFNIPFTDYQFDPSIEGIKTAAGIAYDLGADAIRAIINKLAPGLLDFLGNVVGFIKDKIVSAIDSLTGGLFSKIQSQGFTSILVDLFGAAFSAVGTGVTEGCAAIAKVARKLFDFAKKLAGPAIQAFKKLLSKIGDFFSWLWNDFGQPAWDAIKKYAGKAWDWIVEKATWLWDLTKPIRETVGRAWDWIKRQFGIAWGEAKSTLSWLQKKATAAWDWVKEKIQPIIGPLKTIGKVLLMLSPAGPVIAIAYAAPHVWNAIKWLAENFNKYVIIKSKDYFYHTILPALKSGLNQIQSTVNSAMTWLHSGLTTLGTAINSLFTSLGNFILFRMIRSGILAIGNGLQAGVTFVKSKALLFGKWVSSVAARVWNFLEPLRNLLRNLLMIGLLGPYSIMDDKVWKMLVDIVNFSLKVPCIRELEGLLQVPFWIEQISKVRQTIKDMWFMINHPEVMEAKAKAFLEPYIKEIPGKSESVLMKALAKVGLSASKHTAGILKYLVPAATHLIANWWPEVKKMLWYLIWPFAEGSPLWTDGPKLWKLIPPIWSNIWHGRFSMARDGFLEWMQALNNVVGIFAGWIAIGGALIGAIVGAFAGGVGAIPGAGAGFEIGIEIGEGIMISMIATETAIISAAIYDLIATPDDDTAAEKKPAPATASPSTTATAGGQEEPKHYESGDVHNNHDRIEYAYQRIGNSAITLGIMGVFILLGAIGGEIAEALMGALKKAGSFIAEKLPALAELATDAGKAISESKVGQGLKEFKTEFNKGRALVKGEVPTPERPVIDEEGRSIVEADKSVDGQRQIEVTEQGKCLVCSSPCKKLLEKYDRRINKLDAEGGAVRQRIMTIEDSGMSARSKIAKFKEIDAILDGSIKADGFTPLSPEHKLQRWLDFQLKHPETFPEITQKIDPIWERQYETIIKNNIAGSEFEQDVLKALNRKKNGMVMATKDGKITFTPDAVTNLDGSAVTKLEWGKDYRFTEVKGWQEMSDTGNLSLMLDYVEAHPASKIDIVFTSDHPLTGQPTELSAPLKRRIQILKDKGQATVKYHP